MHRDFEIKDSQQVQIVGLDKGDQIKNLRNSLELTQEEFGEILGVEKLTVCRWEIGLRECKGPAKILINILSRYNLWPKNKKKKDTHDTDF
jgi:DNA-binding transcriptional regulator YiaG